MIGSFSVSPRNVRRTGVRAMESASSDRRHDGEVVAVLERGLQPRPEANVLVVPVDVDELAELSLVVVEALLEAREFLIQFVQRLGHVPGIDLDNGRAASQLPQSTGNANLDRHVVVIIGRGGGSARHLYALSAVTPPGPTAPASAAERSRSTRPRR